MTYENEAWVMVLLTAILRQWVRDARQSEYELQKLAAFVERDPVWLRRVVCETGR